MGQIKFGTDGWRAIIAKDFTFANCRVVTQGIASYINSHNLGKKGIVIGYDNRFMSENFARECARVLVGNGIRVYLLRKAAPTPVTAYAILIKEAGGAIMITASHNPPEYNGIKFIPEYAGPALPEVTEVIEEEVNRLEAGGKVYELNLAEAAQFNLFEEVDIEEDYINHMMMIVQPEHFKEKNIKVVIDPMYGAGIGYLDKILGRLGCEVRTINNLRDTLFGGQMPEPTDELLGDLKRAVVSYNADIGLATDGDADRFGIIDRDGNFMTANRFMQLLLIHLLKTRGYRGPVCRSVATTHLLDKIARRNGLSIVETPVGFKYIGEAMREKGGLMGGEESGGLSIFGHIPEKDGILACMLAVEMLAYSSKTFTELQEESARDYGQAESRRYDIKVETEEKARILEKIREYKPRSIAGVRVDTSNEMDGVKIVLEDGSWVLIRSSGTEPVFRIYVEAPDLTRVENMSLEVMESVGLSK
ncbi:MAG: phosphoglucomutase/phosphomannomutase family protein [Syntrophomonadaceae bacterium]|nr:phosphoglucomutase/phosphomannomutase family protein [Syntrophomonadaceae bacterium]